jgi:hypothetical protein
MLRDHESETAQAGLTNEAPAVQSQPKQDLKQFGDFSLGEVAAAAASNPGSNYGKAAEIESGDERS